MSGADGVICKARRDGLNAFAKAVCGIPFSLTASVMRRYRRCEARSAAENGEAEEGKYA